MGSERGQGDSIPAGRETGGGASVSIPHSGLRTMRMKDVKKLLTMSSSHTVGLEQVYRRTRALAGDFVSIPHGGLRTVNRIAINLSKGDVSIPHSGLRTKGMVGNG